MFVVPIAVMLTGLFAQDVQWTQDGKWWVSTEMGTAAGAQTVKVSTRGPVVIRGSQGDQIQYKLTKRVQARGEKDAGEVDWQHHHQHLGSRPEGDAGGGSGDLGAMWLLGWK